MDAHSRSRDGLGKALVDAGWDGTGFQSDQALNDLLTDAAQGPEAQADLTTLRRNLFANLENFGESKESLADVATDVGIAIAAIAGSVVTAGGSLSLLAKASIAGTMAAAFKVSGKAAVMGSDYDWTAGQVASDGGRGFVYGFTAFIGPTEIGKLLGVGSNVGTAASNSAIKQMVLLAQQGGSQLIKEGSEEVIEQGFITMMRQAILSGSMRVPFDSVNALASQVATKGNEEAVKMVLQISLAKAVEQQAANTAVNLATEYGVTAASGALGGGSAGFVNGVSRWDSSKPIDENLEQVAGTTATSAAIGAVSATAFKVGYHGVESAVNYVMPKAPPSPDQYLVDNVSRLGRFNIGESELALGASKNAPAEVMAVKLEQAVQVLDDAGNVKMQGIAGDWMVISARGQKSFVPDDIFRKYFSAADEIGSTEIMRGVQPVALASGGIEQAVVSQIVPEARQFVSDNVDRIGKFTKRPVQLKAVQTHEATTINTLEGPVKAEPGDWIMTGVKGEQWPVKPDYFATAYDPVLGAENIFQKKPLEVMAVQIDRSMQILDDAGKVKFQGKPGDWMIVGKEGPKYFVDDEIFRQTHLASDAIGQTEMTAVRTAGSTAAANAADRSPVPGGGTAERRIISQVVPEARQFVTDNVDRVGKFTKRPVQLKAVQTHEAMTVNTLEGPVKAEPGDWIMTGVKGENWPVKPDYFATAYDPVPGAENIFQKKPLEVMAVQINRSLEILDDAGKVKFQGKAGDWMVVGKEGPKYFVDDEIFRQTHSASDSIAEVGLEVKLPTPIINEAADQVADKVLDEVARANQLPARTGQTLIEALKSEAGPHDYIVHGVFELKNAQEIRELALHYYAVAPNLAYRNLNFALWSERIYPGTAEYWQTAMEELQRMHNQ